MRKNHGGCRRMRALPLENSPGTLRTEVIPLPHFLAAPEVQHESAMTCISASVATGLKEEDLEYLAEDGNGSQAWVPLRIISKASVSGRLPSVIFLHATGAALFPSQRCVTALMHQV